MSQDAHIRTLVVIIVLLLLVLSLHALALMTLAKRVTVFYLPPRLEAPAEKPARVPAGSAPRIVLPPLSALSLSPLHAPSPAAGEKENPSGPCTADRRGGGVVFYHPKNDEAAGAACVTSRLIMSGHLAMAVSASPGSGALSFSSRHSSTGATADPFRGLDSAALGHGRLDRTPVGASPFRAHRVSRHAPGDQRPL